MQLFYTPDLSGDEYAFSEEESKHCVRVLRKAEGDTVHLVDGRGNLYTAVVTDARPKKCTVRIRETVREYGKRPYRLHVAIAPTKSADRYEWFLEKATEIGIDTVTPLECERSERRSVKTNRGVKVITSAVKQSLKAYHPALEEMTPFREFVGRDFGPVRKFIAHCEPDAEKVLLKNALRKGEDCLVLIGPEGDFSPGEIDLARRNGFCEISLGESRLRTETAGVAACLTAQLANE